MCESSSGTLGGIGGGLYFGDKPGSTAAIPAGMDPKEYMERVRIASQDPATRQFKWQQAQAAKAEQEARERRAAMEQGLGKINETFGRFDDNYFKGIRDKYLAYANPQIERAKASSEFDLRSNLANRGKLGSSTAARQSGDLANTYAGIFRDATAKGEDYANQQRAAVQSAKSASIGQMYASESQDAGLQAASGAVQSLSAGPAFEPVTALLAQAAKFATTDYNNSIYSPNNQSYGLFSPMTNKMAAASSSKTARTVI